MEILTFVFGGSQFDRLVGFSHEGTRQVHMASGKTVQKTTLGDVNRDVLAFTVGKDPVLDLVLAEADCIGSAAHVTMLSRLRVKRTVISKAQRKKVIAVLIDIMRRARRGRFPIRVADQDIHMAVERALTERLGDLGRRVHTGRSRNDQVALDLRLYGKEQLLLMLDETLALAGVLRELARKHARVPMVGRTHMQPAMPSSVGLWASAHAESLLDDVALLIGAYELNDRCPLGAAAGYGVPLPIDRKLTADLLGFSGPVANTLHAINARGKMESIILFAASQVMLSLSRLAEDLMIYTMPEFGYFALPPEYGTGSSIMPQKNNPDAVELARATASVVFSNMCAVMEIVKGLPGGYNRDLQATKEPFMEGVARTRATVRVFSLMMSRLTVNKAALLKGFTPGVFAADRALELVGEGMPFRDAYRHVKEHLDELKGMSPYQSTFRKKHLGAPGGLDLAALKARIAAGSGLVRRERRKYHRAISRLLGVSYPLA